MTDEDLTDAQMAMMGDMRSGPREIVNGNERRTATNLIAKGLVRFDPDEAAPRHIILTDEGQALLDDCDMMYSDD